MNNQRYAEIYSDDRRRRMVVEGRADGRYRIAEERLRSYENGDEYRPRSESFPQDGSVPEWTIVVSGPVGGLFGTAADAAAEAQRFLDEHGTRYEGMSINERLFDAGLIEDFEAAVAARDRAEMIRMFAALDVEDPAWSADAILRNPEWYGF